MTARRDTQASPGAVLCAISCRTQLGEMVHHNVMLMTLKQSTLKELISLQKALWGPGRRGRYKKESPSLSVASVWSLLTQPLS